MNTITMGVDLAKARFAVCEVEGAGRVVRRHDLSRSEYGIWLGQVPSGTVVAMEACGGAHHWGRRCLEYGLVPKLMAAQFVVPFRKSATAKNDRNDAEAIATAARQGNMRFVPVKSVDQQARLAWHRMRAGYQAEGLAISNRVRGLLMEFGVVLPRREACLRAWLADLDQHPELPSEVKELLRAADAHWTTVRACRQACEQRIVAHAAADERCQRLRAIIGVGPLTADAVVATIGDGREFKHGREFAAWLGLTPSQHSSGGHTRLGTIGHRGDSYLRTVLIQGARSSWLQARRAPESRRTREQIWINQLCSRKLFGKVLVAIANKHARQMWAILAHGEAYDPEAWLRHPVVQRSTDKHTTARAAMA